MPKCTFFFCFWNQACLNHGFKPLRTLSRKTTYRNGFSTRNGTNTLTVNGDTYFGGAVSYNGDIVLTDPYKLKSNTISSNLLNDLVFEIDTLGEFFRCKVSDNTVRVPNTRSFLSQDIFTDIIKPLAFANDIVLMVEILQTTHMKNI